MLRAEGFFEIGDKVSIFTSKYSVSRYFYDWPAQCPSYTLRSYGGNFTVTREGWLLTNSSFTQLITKK